MARPLGPVIRLDPRSRGHVRGRRRVSRRRQRRAIRRRFLALMLFCGCVVAATTFVVSRDHHAADVRSQLTSSAMDAPDDAARGLAAAAPAEKRPRYRYSVIPNGVFSAEELQASIAADPVVGEHYQTFDAARATLVHLDRPRLAYVSYRLGDRVFWTRHRVRLEAGEAVLTDGRDVVRTRCGNRVSDVPGETSPDEPDPALIDTPIDDPAPLDDADPDDPALPLLPPVVIGLGGAEGVLASSRPSEPDPPGHQAPASPYVPPEVLVATRREGRTEGRTAVRSVPEPTSLLLLMAGLLGFGVRRLARHG